MDGLPLIAMTRLKVAILNSASQSSSSAGILNGAKVGLYTSLGTVTPATVLADLTEPTWAGYARKSVTWNTPYQGQLNAGELVGNSVIFTSLSDADQLVQGAFVVASDGTTLLWVQPAAEQIAMIGVDALTYVPLFQLL